MPRAHCVVPVVALGLLLLAASAAHAWPTPPGESDQAALEVCRQAPTSKACLRWQMFCALTRAPHPFCAAYGLAPDPVERDYVQSVEDMSEDFFGKLQLVCLGSGVGTIFGNDSEMTNEGAQRYCKSFRRYCELEYPPTLKIMRICDALGYERTTPDVFVLESRVDPATGQRSAVLAAHPVRQVSWADELGKFLEALPGTKVTTLGARLWSGRDELTWTGGSARLVLDGVLGVRPIGTFANVTLELGGHENYGVFSWVGFDVGLGLQWPTGFLGLGAGLHRGGLVTRAWVPMTAEFAFIGPRLGLHVTARLGWRFSDEAHVESQLGLPAGLDSYSVEAVAGVRQAGGVRFGLAVQDMDGRASVSAIVAGGFLASDRMRFEERDQQGAWSQVDRRRRVLRFSVGLSQSELDGKELSSGQFELILLPKNLWGAHGVEAHAMLGSLGDDTMTMAGKDNRLELSVGYALIIGGRDRVSLGLGGGMDMIGDLEPSPFGYAKGEAGMWVLSWLRGDAGATWMRRNTGDEQYRVRAWVTAWRVAFGVERSWIPGVFELTSAQVGFDFWKND